MLGASSGSVLAGEGVAATRRTGESAVSLAPRRLPAAAARLQRGPHALAREIACKSGQRGMAPRLLHMKQRRAGSSTWPACRRVNGPPAIPPSAGRPENPGTSSSRWSARCLAGHQCADPAPKVPGVHAGGGSSTPPPVVQFRHSESKKLTAKSEQRQRPDGQQQMAGNHPAVPSAERRAPDPESPESRVPTPESRIPNPPTPSSRPRGARAA
jgi:hypothetical protein